MLAQLSSIHIWMWNNGGWILMNKPSQKEESELFKIRTNKIINDLHRRLSNIENSYEINDSNTVFKSGSEFH